MSGQCTLCGSPVFAKRGQIGARFGRFPPDSGVPDQEGEYATGDNVVVAIKTTLREEPSGSSRLLRSMPVGINCAVNGGVRKIGSTEWYYVNVEGGDDEGYILGSRLDPAPKGNPASPKFEVGDRVKVTTSDLNLRRPPGIAQLVARISSHTARFSGSVLLRSQKPDIAGSE